MGWQPGQSHQDVAQILPLSASAAVQPVLQHPPTKCASYHYYVHSTQILLISMKQTFCPASSDIIMNEVLELCPVVGGSGTPTKINPMFRKSHPSLNDILLLALPNGSTEASELGIQTRYQSCFDIPTRRSNSRPRQQVFTKSHRHGIFHLQSAWRHRLDFANS